MIYQVDQLESYRLRFSWMAPVNPIDTIARVETYMAVVDKVFPAFDFCISHSRALRKLPAEIILLIKDDVYKSDYEERVSQLKRELRCAEWQCDPKCHDGNDEASLLSWERALARQAREEQITPGQSNWVERCIHKHRKVHFCERLDAVHRELKVWFVQRRRVSMADHKLVHSQRFKLGLEIVWQHQRGARQSLHLYFKNRRIAKLPGGRNDDVSIELLTEANRKAFRAGLERWRITLLPR